MPREYAISPFMVLAAKSGGSDVHIKPDAVPKIRIKGALTPVKHGPLSADTVRDMVFETMDVETREKFERKREADYAIDIPGAGRFRVNAYYMRGRIGLVARLLSENPRSLEELKIPAIAGKLAMVQNGLILVTGATGSGKSSTLAAMVDHINKNKSAHIVTIEDPIEIIHQDAKSSISQRELHADTSDFTSALRAALRQDPDVILIGEMRDLETAKIAMHAAETGHLVLSTLHTNSAADTINRVIALFPPTEQAQIRLTLSEILRGVICQRLVVGKNKSRIPVIEVLVNEGRAPDAIAQPEKVDLHGVIAEGKAYGMQTFEDHLLELFKDGAIEVETALKTSNNPHDLRIKLRPYVDLRR